MLDIFKHDIDVNTMHLLNIIEASEKQKENMHRWASLTRNLTS